MAQNYTIRTIVTLCILDTNVCMHVHVYMYIVYYSSCTIVYVLAVYVAIMLYSVLV